MRGKTKYRKIDTRIWNDAKFCALSHSGKLVFFFLLTHPTMTPLGAIRANVPGLAFELGMGVEDFTEAFGEVLGQGMAEHDAKGMLIWFPNFLKHNIPESPNVVRSWVPAVRDLPESNLKDVLLEHAACTIDGLSEGFRKAFAEAFGKECAQGIDNQGAGNREQGEKKEAPSGALVPPADGTACDEHPAPEPEPKEEPAETAAPDEAEAEECAEEPEGAGDAPRVPPCPHTRIVEAYNRVCGAVLPQVREITEKRKRILRSRWVGSEERQSLRWWEGYFECVAASKFLTGQRGRFKASFDWLINPSNMVKVLEGNYHDGGQGVGANGASSAKGGESVGEHNRRVMDELMGDD